MSLAISYTKSPSLSHQSNSTLESTQGVYDPLIVFLLSGFLQTGVIFRVGTEQYSLLQEDFSRLSRSHATLDEQKL